MAPLENGELQPGPPFWCAARTLQTDHQLLSGCSEDVLRKVNGARKVTRRTMVLDANAYSTKTFL